VNQKIYIYLQKDIPVIRGQLPMCGEKIYKRFSTDMRRNALHTQQAMPGRKSSHGNFGIVKNYQSSWEKDTLI
jgi:hypothetical protein